MSNVSYNHALHVRFSRQVAFGRFQECWEWVGARVTSARSAGYKWGVISIKNKTFKASRVSWMLNRGEIPRGLNVLHLCDNSLCVNPGHLFLGTQSENVSDMDRKGRRRNGPKLGESHWNCKLSAEQVKIIRSHKGSGAPLAERFGVSLTQINNIRRSDQRKEG